MASLLAFPFLLSTLLTGCPGPEVSSAEGDDPSQCTDGIDNDANGLVDCADEGCQVWSVCGGDTDTDTDADTDTDSDADADTDTDTDTDTAPPDEKEATINEFMASNSATLMDPGDNSYPDWVELYNLTDADIDLGGYTMTDDLEDKAKVELPAGLVLPASGYLILFADGNPEKGADHLDFKLTKSGESLGLYRADGTPLDKLNYGAQATDQSACQMPDGSGTWEIDATPTPGAANN